MAFLFARVLDNAPLCQRREAENVGDSGEEEDRALVSSILLNRLNTAPVHQRISPWPQH